jgi:glycosyltransferase involved in cell wall biosynthesis
MRYSFLWADNVVAVSTGVAQDLLHTIHLPSAKVQTIYNPAVNSQFYEDANCPLDDPWFTHAAPPVVLGVGRLHRQKDFSLLIRAFSLIRKERSVRRMILGEGEDRPALEALVKDLGLEEDVALPGFVENPYRYMKAAAVFALSSRWEGFGLVLVEAMAVGTPVVSTDCPSGPAEILEGGKWGRLVPVGDAHVLAGAIISALDDPSTPEGIHHRVLDFSVDHLMQQYLDVLFGEARNS